MSILSRPLVQTFFPQPRPVADTIGGYVAAAYPPPLLNCVIFGAGGFGYFLTDSKYSSTALSAGPETQPNNPPTTKSSCGSISMLNTFGVAGHRSTGRENAGLALRSNAGRMNVGKVYAPLFPARGDQIGTDEAQEALAMSHHASAEQDVGLIDAVNWPIRWHVAAHDVGKGRQEIHD